MWFLNRIIQNEAAKIASFPVGKGPKGGLWGRGVQGAANVLYDRSAPAFEATLAGKDAIADVYDTFDGAVPGLAQFGYGTGQQVLGGAMSHAGVLKDIPVINDLPWGIPSGIDRFADYSVDHAGGVSSSGKRNQHSGAIDAISGLGLEKLGDAAMHGGEGLGHLAWGGVRNSPVIGTVLDAEGFTGPMMFGTDYGPSDTIGGKVTSAINQFGDGGISGLSDAYGRNRRPFTSVWNDIPGFGDDAIEVSKAELAAIKKREKEERKKLQARQEAERRRKADQRKRDTIEEVRNTAYHDATDRDRATKASAESKLRILMGPQGWQALGQNGKGMEAYAQYQSGNYAAVAASFDEWQAKGGVWNPSGPDAPLAPRA